MQEHDAQKGVAKETSDELKLHIKNCAFHATSNFVTSSWYKLSATKQHYYIPVILDIGLLISGMN